MDSRQPKKNLAFPDRIVKGAEAFGIGSELRGKSNCVAFTSSSGEVKGQADGRVPPGRDSIGAGSGRGDRGSIRAGWGEREAGSGGCGLWAARSSG